MIIEYIDEALRRVRYEKIDDDEPYYGEIAELQGVWVTGKTLEECRSVLKEVLVSPQFCDLDADLSLRQLP